MNNDKSLEKAIYAYATSNISLFYNKTEQMIRYFDGHINTFNMNVKYIIDTTYIKTTSEQFNSLPFGNTIKPNLIIIYITSIIEYCLLYLIRDEEMIRSNNPRCYNVIMSKLCETVIHELYHIDQKYTTSDLNKAIENDQIEAGTYAKTYFTMKRNGVKYENLFNFVMHLDIIVTHKRFLDASLIKYYSRFGGMSTYYAYTIADIWSRKNINPEAIYQEQLINWYIANIERYIRNKKYKVVIFNIIDGMNNVSLRLKDIIISDDFQNFNNVIYNYILSRPNIVTLDLSIFNDYNDIATINLYTSGNYLMHPASFV